MTKCDSPVDCHGPPVQKLVAHSTLTNLASSFKPLIHLEDQGLLLFCLAGTVGQAFGQAQNVIRGYAVIDAECFQMSDRNLGLAGLIAPIHGSANFQKVSYVLLGKITIFPKTSEDFISFHIITAFMVTDGSNLC